MRWRGLSGGRSTRCLHCKLTTKECPTDTQALTWRHVTHTMGSSPFLYAPVTAWEWLLAESVMEESVVLEEEREVRVCAESVSLQPNINTK